MGALGEQFGVRPLLKDILQYICPGRDSCPYNQRASGSLGTLPHHSAILPPSVIIEKQMIVVSFHTHEEHHATSHGITCDFTFYSNYLGRKQEAEQVQCDEETAGEDQVDHVQSRPAPQNELQETRGIHINMCQQFATYRNR